MNSTNREKRDIEDFTKLPWYDDDTDREYTGVISGCDFRFLCTSCEYEDDNVSKTHMNKFFWINRCPFFTKREVVITMYYGFSNAHKNATYSMREWNDTHNNFLNKYEWTR